VVERIFKYRIRQHIDIDDMQFGFLKGKGTTDAILIVRQMQKFRAKGKKLYFSFVDLEKACLFVACSVSMLVMWVSPAEMAQPVKNLDSICPMGLTYLDLRNH